MAYDGLVEAAAAGLAVRAAEGVDGGQVVIVCGRDVGGRVRRERDRLGFPGAAGESEDVAGDVEAVSDLLEERQLLHPAVVVHVVVDAALGDVRGGRDPAGADASGVQQPEDGSDVPLGAGLQQPLVAE
ncbi:hypothetical protein ACIQUQ_30280 [Streptomyces sp. NPDC101118]|uniref:hypothetical protein n=1 Tax=Streptomyces sp. NPDC101118 TaxID=3366109 RepID=UPI00380A8004